jgi:hypothetical protein
MKRFSRIAAFCAAVLALPLLCGLQPATCEPAPKPIVAVKGASPWLALKDQPVSRLEFGSWKLERALVGFYREVQQVEVQGVLTYLEEPEGRFMIQIRGGGSASELQPPDETIAKQQCTLALSLAKSFFGIDASTGQPVDAQLNASNVAAFFLPARHPAGGKAAEPAAALDHGVDLMGLFRYQKEGKVLPFACSTKLRAKEVEYGKIAP